MARRYKTTLQYNPFTFQELWTPAAYSEQRHIAQLEKYEEYLKNTSDVLQYLDPDRDPESYAAVSNMMNNVNNLAKDLSMRGLSGNNNMNTLLGLAKDYGTTVKPILNKIEAYKQTVKDYKTKKMEDPSYETFADINSLSIDNIDIFNGFDMSGVSGAKLGQKISAVAEIFGKIQKGMKISQFSRDYDLLTTEFGMTQEEIDAINNGTDTSSALYNMVERIKESEGYYNLSDQQKAKMDSYIAMGVQSAVGQTRRELKENKNYNWATLDEKRRAHDLDYGLAMKKLQLDQDRWQQEFLFKAAIAGAKLNKNSISGTGSNRADLIPATISNGINVRFYNNPYEQTLLGNNEESKKKLISMAIKSMRAHGKTEEDMTADNIALEANRIREAASNFGMITSIKRTASLDKHFVASINIDEHGGELKAKDVYKHPEKYGMILDYDMSTAVPSPVIYIMDIDGKCSDKIYLDKIDEDLVKSVNSMCLPYFLCVNGKKKLPANPLETQELAAGYEQATRLVYNVLKQRSNPQSEKVEDYDNE